MIPSHNLQKIVSTHRTQYQENQKNNQNTFQKKFKLTQKINKLSSSPIYERTLSPWARKRGQSIDRKQYNVEQSTERIDLTNQIPINTIRQNPSNLTDENKLNDFLRKIQFTKRKKNITQSNFNKDKNSKSFQNDSLEKIQSNNSHQHNLFQFSTDQIKKLIMYPKVSSPMKFNQKQNHQSPIKKCKSKQQQYKKMATIQTFYDPFQITTKSKFIIQKGAYKYKNDNQLLENNAKSLTDLAVLSLNSQISIRKNSLHQKSYRQRINAQEQNSIPIQGYFYTNVKGTHGGFFKSHRRGSTDRTRTQPCQTNFRYNQNPQNKKLSISQPIRQEQPTYITPSGQAVKRIKQQYKKSHRVKTQAKQSIRSFDQYQSLMKTQQKQYLYKTFMKYKTQKHSNVLNITKTLKFTFHNKQSFNQNLKKVFSKNKFA